MTPAFAYENKSDGVQTYHDYHDLTVEETSNMLRRYSGMSNWNKYRTVMDIGCGPADYTFKYLLPLLPPDAQIIAVDKSTRIIEYARSHYQNDRLKLDIMDIGNQNHAEKYKQTFDMIFSTYCLHWLPDQWTTMKNIYSMLKNDGDFIALFIVDTPFFSLMEEIVTMDKWKKYTMDLGKVRFPYRNDPNPEKTLNTILSSLDFLVNECIVNETSNVFPSLEVFTKTVYGIVSLEVDIPEDLVDEFNADCLSIMKTNKNFTFHKNGPVVLKYSIFNVHCSKRTETSNDNLVN